MSLQRLVLVVAITGIFAAVGRAGCVMAPVRERVPSPDFTVNSEGQDPGRKAKKIWKISAALLGAVTIADVHSSIGRREMNPLLASHNGQFSARGISIKAAIVGSALGAQYLMLRKRPEAAGYAAGVNFGAAAFTGSVAARNYMRR